MKKLEANYGYTIFRATDEKTETTTSGLYVPETSRENQHMIFGEVVSSGGTNSKEVSAVFVLAGDKIATLRNKVIKFIWDNEELYLVHTTDIMFVEIDG